VIRQPRPVSRAALAFFHFADWRPPHRGPYSCIRPPQPHTSTGQHVYLLDCGHVALVYRNTGAVSCPHRRCTTFLPVRFPETCHDDVMDHTSTGWYVYLLDCGHVEPVYRINTCVSYPHRSCTTLRIVRFPRHVTITTTRPQVSTSTCWTVDMSHSSTETRPL
jgi:hypothetical protein